MLEIGSLVDGKYKILSEVGRGGMSIVYMAINEKANKTWAIKEVRKDSSLEFERVKQSLIAETNILKNLSHPSLPSIVDIIEEEDVFLIVMDYIEGNSLADTIREYGAQSQDRVIEWAKELADILMYLHSQNPPIIYRDMKPGNIMLRPDGSITLVDFGIAREYKEENLADTSYLGTRGYAAPEQFGQQGQTDARTDIYCLGASLHHLLTNIDPCKETVYEMQPIRMINPNLSKGLESIIMNCIAPNPKNRYQSAAELMYDLDNVEEIDDDYKKKQRKKVFFFGLSLVLSLVFLISGLALRFFASSLAEDDYQEKIRDAQKANSYEQKIKLYEEAIKVPQKAGVLDAYLGLIQSYKADSVFSQEESLSLERLFKANQAELAKNKADYITLNFEIGKLYWYHFEAKSQNAVYRIKSSIAWFQTVLDLADENYQHYNMAMVYTNVGLFYRDIQMNIAEVNDQGQYKPLYENLLKFLEILKAEKEESEIVKLELADLARTALRQYATKFKLDGLKKADLDKLYSKIESLLAQLDLPLEDQEDIRVIKLEAILKEMPDTKRAIESAYSTRTEE